MQTCPQSHLVPRVFVPYAGLTKRGTLKRSIRGAVLIGCSKTMQMTGTKSETHLESYDQAFKPHSLVTWSLIRAFKGDTTDTIKLVSVGLKPESMKSAKGAINW